jgi:hypothetical protein
MLYFLIQCPNRPESSLTNTFEKPTRFYRKHSLSCQSTFYFQKAVFKIHIHSESTKAKIVKPCPYEIKTFTQFFSFHNSNVSLGPHNAGVFLLPLFMVRKISCNKTQSFTATMYKRGSPIANCFLPGIL